MSANERVYVELKKFTVSKPSPAKTSSFVELSFSEAMDIAKRSFTAEDLELDSDDDELKDVNKDILDESNSTKDSIARNRPVRSSSIRSQKLVSDYFRQK